VWRERERKSDKFIAFPNSFSHITGPGLAEAMNQSSALKLFKGAIFLVCTVRMDISWLID